MNAAKEAREFAELRQLQKLLRYYEKQHGHIFGLREVRQHVIEQMRRVAKLVTYGMPVLALLLFVVPAFAQEHHHPTGTIYGAVAEFYKSWMRPDVPTSSCCNDRDCYVTRIRRVNGKIQAVHRESGDWIDIPPEKVEVNRDSPDGFSHLCATAAKYVFCFKEGGGT